MKSQKFIKLIFGFGIIIGLSGASNEALAQYAERSSSGTSGDTFQLQSFWGGELGSGSQISNIYAEYSFEISSNPDALQIGSTINLNKSGENLMMQVFGGNIPGTGYSAAGSWPSGPSAGCPSGGATFSVAGNSYNFVLCSEVSGFTLSSSNPGVVSCSGQSCIVNSAGNATITATPSQTSVYIFGTRNGGEIISLGPATLQAASVSWNVSAYDPPEVNIFANDTEITAGDPVVLSWSATRAEYGCEASISPDDGWNGWEGTKPVSGSQTINPYGSYSYILECEGLGGTSSDSVSVVAGSPIGQPEIYMWSDNAVVNVGESTNFHWTVTNANSCSASWMAGDPGFSGQDSTGIFSVNEERSYIMSCSNSQSAASYTLKIRSNDYVAPMSLQLSANRENINSGESVTLQWAAQNAASCTASGNWSGDRPTSSSAGGESQGPLYADAYYRLTCRNSIGQEIFEDLNITVNPISGPEIVFDIRYVESGVTIMNPATIPHLGDITLIWSATDVLPSSCQASGSWSGDISASGAYDRYNLTQSNSPYTYTITCTGLNGSVISESRTISAEAAPAQPVALIFYADEYFINPGDRVRLYWTSTNATYCYSTGDGWENTTRSTSNDINSPYLYSDSYFALQCFNTSTGLESPIVGFMIDIDESGNGSGEGLGPTILLELQQYSGYPAPVPQSEGPYDYLILRNSYARLHWEAPGALSCWASGGNWSGFKAVPTGNQDVYISADRMYQITCSNYLGESSAMITVGVTDPELPEIFITSVNPPSPIPYDTGTRISYNVDFNGYSSGTGCRVSASMPIGGFTGEIWTSAYATGNIFDTPDLLDDTIIRFRCYSPAGETFEDVPIDVGDPPGPMSFNFWPDSNSVPYNSSVRLNWNADNASFCLASGSGWENVGYKEALPGVNYNEYSRLLTEDPTLFTLECYDNDGDGYAQVIPVAVGDSPPMIDFSAVTTYVPYNTSAELEWEIQAPGGVTCRAEGGGTDNLWTGLGELDLEGTFETGHLTGNTLYTIRCNDASSTSESILILVGPQGEASPSVSFWATNNVADSGGNAVLHWTSVNAVDNCDAYGDWSGNDIGTSGDRNVGGITETRKYTIVCRGPAGDVSASVIIVPHDSDPPPMSLSFWSDEDENIDMTQQVMVHWKTSNAESCTASYLTYAVGDTNLTSPTGWILDASGNWTGSRDLVGSQKVGPFPSIGRYRLFLTCENQQGATRRSELLLSVGCEGLGSRIVQYYIATDTHFDSLPVREGDPAIPAGMPGYVPYAGAFMFNANEENDEHLYLTMSVSNAIQCVVSDDRLPSEIFKNLTNSNVERFDLGVLAGFSGRTINVSCIDINGQTNTLYIPVGAYKLDVCIDNPSIIVGQQRSASSYYDESFDNSNSLENSPCWGSGNVTDESTWSKQGEHTEAISIGSVQSGDTSVEVNGISYYYPDGGVPNSGLYVKAAYKPPYLQNINARKQVVVDDFRDCFNCDTASGNCSMVSGISLHESCFSHSYYNTLSECAANCKFSSDKYREVQP